MFFWQIYIQSITWEIDGNWSLEFPKLKLQTTEVLFCCLEMKWFWGQDLRLRLWKAVSNDHMEADSSKIWWLNRWSVKYGMRWMGKSWGKPLTTIDHLELIVGLYIRIPVDQLLGVLVRLYVKMLCERLGSQVGVESTLVWSWAYSY